MAVEQHQHQCLANHKTIALNVEHEEGKKPRRLAKGAGLLKRGPRPLTAVLAAGLAVALLLLLLAGGRVGVPKVDPRFANSLPDAPDGCSAALRSKIAWGVATSAYQVEGAWDEGGRSPSIWDTFSQQPGHTYGNATGNVAAEHYHQYQQDIKLMLALGVKHYRLSLSWSRILPGGGRGTEPNAAGLRFYRHLLQELHAAGITPVVTLYHMDLPQVLQDTYGGFLDQQLSEDFLYYADIVFAQLGPYVKHWLTFSDPMAICQLGYGVGVYAPGVEKGAAGHYRCGHTLLLAHAKAVQLYRLKYQQLQEGRISMVISAHWGLPFDSSSKADRNATDTYMQFQVGWMADPLFFGDYPEVMRRSQPKLPKFKEAEKRLLAGSVDFFALNYYTSHFVKAAPPGAPKDQVYEESLTDHEGRHPGTPSDVFWQFSAPDGLRSTLNWIGRRYQRPEVWVTENGVASPGESAKDRWNLLKDMHRLDFYRTHLDSLCAAVTKDSANLAAFFAWSLLDAFEFSDGYRARYGIVHVDRTSKQLQRYPKLSAYWLSQHFFRYAPDSIACLEIRSCRATRSTLLHV